MKLLSREILGISKFLLPFNFLLIGGLHAQELVSSDRFLIKILDSVVTVQDVNYQLRNLKALDCIYEDSLVVSYFEKKFLTELGTFVSHFPEKDEDVIKFLHANPEMLKKIRYFFKMLRYSEDQNKKVSVELSKLIREGTRENNCQKSILHKDSLKTNFKSLIEMELYLRSRYEGQLRSHKRNFDFIRPSIDLFIDSLDKQLTHEYFW
jgi:hypothetical protein